METGNDRRKRLDFVIRRNAGKARIGPIQRTLEAIVGTPVHFLPLEQSDEIRRRGSESSLDGEALSEWLLPRTPTRPLSLVPPSEGSLYLLLPDEAEIGVLQMDAGSLNRFWLPVLNAFPDGLRFYNPTFKDYCDIQVVEDPPLWQEMIEIRVRGREWTDWITDQIGCTGT